MGLHKYGRGEILPEDGDLTALAKPEFTQADAESLAAENAEADFDGAE